MDEIIEINLQRYRKYLGIDKFAAWIKAKLYEGKKDDLPFSFGTRYDFEDILGAIYKNLDNREKTDMQWALACAAKDWSITEHGFYVLRKLYEWGLIIEGRGVFSETLCKIYKWSPLPQDYLNIIELGKIADELWSAIVKFDDIEIKDTSFYPITKHFKKILVDDEDEHFKLIYSPLFRLACLADINDWSRLAAIIAKRYPYNNKKDPWPEECAIFTNAASQSGFFNLVNTYKEVFRQYDENIFLDGCKRLEGELINTGGFECLQEVYGQGLLEIKLCEGQGSVYTSKHILMIGDGAWEGDYLWKKQIGSRGKIIPLVSDSQYAPPSKDRKHDFDTKEHSIGMLEAVDRTYGLQLNL